MKVEEFSAAGRPFSYRALLTLVLLVTVFVTREVLAKKLKNSKAMGEAKDISKLMEGDDEDPDERRAHLVDVDGPASSERAAGNSHIDGAEQAKSKKVRKPAFRYESKLDRAKARAQLKESNAKWAEKRREERVAGGGKGRMQKNKGKRGHGNKGKKK